MKKIIILAIILTSIVSCSKYNYQISDNCYTVYKITSRNENRMKYYEIYAQKGSMRYKIINPDEKSNNGIKIKRGGCYNFKLESITEHLNRGFGTKATYYGALAYSKKTLREMMAGKVIETYYPSNLKGLYYIEQ